MVSFLTRYNPGARGARRRAASARPLRN